MNRHVKEVLFLIAVFFVSSTTVFAAAKHHKIKHKHHKTAQKIVADYKGEVVPIPYEARGHFEIIGGGGVANLRASDFTDLGVTDSENDTLVQTNKNSWDTGVGQIGLGYVYYLTSPSSLSSDDIQYFTAIAPQLNVYYYSSDSIKGDVYRFGNPAFNQLSFDIPIRSTRLMLDLAVTLASWHQLSLYAKGGLGEAWTRIGYSDSVNAPFPCNITNLQLSKRYKSHFAYEAGAGLQYDFNSKYGLSLEYLYGWWGRLRTPSNVNGNTLLSSEVEPATFNLRSQAVLLDLHVAIT